MSAQLSLPVSLREEATFANFLAVEPIRAQLVQQLSGGGRTGINLIYLWGAPGAGASHLVQALCHRLEGPAQSGQYLPLPELEGFDPTTLLEGLENQPLVCLEDIQCVGGVPEWERGLFNLYNRLLAAGHLLVISADAPPARLGLQLPDLVSRLGAGLVFHLPSYSDDQKRAILRFRSARLGLEMSEEVATFLLNRFSRDLNNLMALLGRLDTASLEKKRRLTVPFVKQVLGG